MKNKIEYHIHINAYTINEKTVKKLLKINLESDPFVQKSNHKYSPKLHFSHYGNSKEKNDKIWELSLNILNTDPSFRGYIESEIAPKKFLKYFKNENSQYNEDTQYPFKKIKLIKVETNKHKISDIHIYRNNKLKRDLLDELLLKTGFFEVHTQNENDENISDERIFTIQTEDFYSSKYIYNKLSEFFSKNKGISKIELEITRKLKKYPETFEVSKYVPKNYFIN